MAEHKLKTIEPYYSDVEQGFKDFEVRKNDRPFDVGDTLILQQYVDGALTGKETRRKIKYILFDENFVKERFCILGLENTRAAEPEPRALTLKELREMDGKPVYIVEHPNWGHWELSKDAEDYFEDRDTDFYGWKYNDPNGEYGLHVFGWLAFDRQLKGE